MAPDEKLGWKRECTTCHKIIQTDLEFFNWHNITCIDCFSKVMAKLTINGEKLRIVDCKNGLTLAWIHPTLGYTGFYKDFEITQEYLNKM